MCFVFFRPIEAEVLDTLSYQKGKTARVAEFETLLPATTRYNLYKHIILIS